MTDLDLLKRYVGQESQEAFAVLVHKYSNLVYSAALRQVGHPEDAEDVAQTVFILLARKAGTIGDDTVLPGWLVRTTRFVALNAKRNRALRWRTQIDVMSQSLHQTETETTWAQISPILDEALVSLTDKDRDAAVLRFFDQKSFKEIASVIGGTDDGAQKRVARAIEKLRRYFARRGVVVPSVLVAGALASKGVQAAPEQLALSISAKAALASHNASLLSALEKGSLAAFEEAVSRKALMELAGAAVALLLLALFGWLLWPKTPGSQFAARQPGMQPANARPGFALPANQPAQPAQRNLVLRVLALSTGTQIARAQVTSSWRTWDTRSPTSITKTLATDAEGQCSISFPTNADGLWGLRLEIQKDGYVRRFVNWVAGRGDTPEGIPAEFTTQLAAGQVIGGIVVSARGEPVSGASVAIVDAYPSDWLLSEARREGPALSHVEVTDEAGRWLCSHAPRRPGVTFLVSHPNYVAASYVPVEEESTAGPTHLPMGDLVNQTAVMVLKPGIPIAGVVLDQEHKPIAGARITESQLWDNLLANQVTGVDGRFSFGNTSEADLTLTARAVGFVTDDMIVRPGPSSPEVFFVLKRGGILRGRVLDEKGVPIGNASVIAEGGQPARTGFEWSTSTDEQGRFEWLSVPFPQMKYAINAFGYQRVKHLELPGDGSECVVRLRGAPVSRPLRISGVILNAETQRPVKDFQVWVTTTLIPNMTLAKELKTTGEYGRFAFLELFYSFDNLQRMEVEVRADGYLAGSATLDGPFTNDCEVGLRLKPFPSVTGDVQLPDGQSADGAIVVLCAKASNASIGNGIESSYMSSPGQLDLQFSQAAHVETDADGRFKLSPSNSEGTLVVVHKLGFFSEKLDRPNEFQRIRLQPYGRVSGVLRVLNEPGGGRVVVLANPQADENPFLRLRLTAQTDGEGRFSFEGVPPGEWILSPHDLRVRVESARTTEVALGGGGRKLVGQLTLKEQSQRVPWKDYQLVLATQVPGWPAPSRDQFPSALEYSTTLRQWLVRKSQFRLACASPDAVQQPRQYQVPLSADGSFSLEEVLPGAYDLQFVLDPLRYDGKTMSWLAGISRSINVPDTTGNNDAAPLDLGAVELSAP